MDFTFEIRFDSGRAEGDDNDPQVLMMLADLLRQKAAGVQHTPIKLGGASRTVSEIRSIEIRAAW